MPTLFEKLQLEREEYRKKIEEIDLLVSLLRKYGIEDAIAEEQMGSQAEKLLGRSGDTVLWPSVASSKRTVDFSSLRTMKTPESRPTRNLPRKRMYEVVTQILRERKKPMTRHEMVDALEMKGIPVAGVDRPKAIGTILWRMRKHFVNLPGWGYWLINEDFPPAAYKGARREESDEDEGIEDVKLEPPLELPGPDDNG